MTVSNYLTKFNGKTVKDFETGKPLDLNYAYRFDSPYDAKQSVVDKLTEFVKQTDTNSVEELLIGVWQDAYEQSPDHILKYLIDNKDKFSNLKHIFFGDMTYEDCEISWIIQTGYEEFLSHFTKLETLIIRGSQELSLGKFNLPQLKTLIIQSGGLPKNVLNDVLGSSVNLASLEHFELWLGTDNYGADIEISDLTPVLNGQFYTGLKHLGLKDSEMQDEIVVALEGASILDRLETLDVSMGTLSEKGAEAMLKNEKLKQLKHINCRHHFIPDELVKKLQETFGDKINLNDQQDLDEEWRYVEVSE